MSAVREVASIERPEPPRHFLDIDQLGTAELRRMLDTGLAYKHGRRDRPLAGKTLAMIFEKPSTRTRVSFEVAVRHLTKQVGPESSVAIGIERSARRDRAGLEVGFQLRQPNEASPLFRTAEAGIEWAVAQKVVALHGGELLERNEGPEAKSLVIFLPLCP